MLLLMVMFDVMPGSDLLHVSGIGHSLGVGFQHTPPPEPETRRPSPGTMGSDILDSNCHELKLEKSNILLLGPTGSGEDTCNSHELKSNIQLLRPTGSDEDTCNSHELKSNILLLGPTGSGEETCNSHELKSKYLRAVAR